MYVWIPDPFNYQNPLILKAAPLPKTIIILLSGLFLHPGSAGAQVNLSSGLMAYYPFSGNANDASGNGNNATITNATLTTDRYGNANSAYSFNGFSNYIMIPNNLTLNSQSQLSICALVKPMGYYAGVCHGNSVVMKGDEDFLTGNYFLRFDDALYTNDNNCYTSQVDTLHQLFYGRGTSQSSDYIQTGTWYCVIYIYDGASEKLYVDGVMVDSTYAPGYTFTNAFDLYFGHMNNSTYPYWFNGVLDEVRIYNRPLNIEEVDSLCGVKYCSDCCPPLQGTLTGGTVCSGAGSGMLSFDSPDSTGPYTLTLSSGTASYTVNDVVSQTPFAVPLAGNYTWSLTSIKDTTTCPATPVTDVKATMSVQNCAAICADSIAAGWAIPSGFTPNGDGHNDCFGIAHAGVGELEELSIYDRWGQRVFTTANAGDCWNGYIDGQPAQVGAYVYMIRISTRCGETMKKGTLMLIR